MAFPFLQFVYLQYLLTIFVAASVAVLLWALNRKYFWKRLGLPNVPGTLLLGNIKDALIVKKNCAQVFDDLYSHPNSINQPVVGIHIFHKPALLIRDLDLIKKILIRNFDSFSNRYSHSDPKTDSLGAYNLFLVRNPLWRQIRHRLTPMFTSGKMKQMFHLVSECGTELDEYLCTLETDSNTNSVQREIKEICARYTTDVIATCAYGVQANSIKNPNAEFRQHGKRVFDITFKRALEFMAIFFLPEVVPLFRVKVFSKETTRFLRSAIGGVLAHREKSGQTRNDLIDILVSLKNDDKAKKEGDLNEAVFKGDMLVAQASIFFTAGFETSSSTMSFAMYEMSKKPDIQKRLREEIRQTLIDCQGKLNYESINGMPYLHMVISETLRMYPPLPFLDRICTPPTNKEGYYLDSYADYTIPPGMPVFIPAYSIQRDPQYFPDPNNFNPERFAPEAVKATNAYMPFGLGPHNCIGERFGIMQAKIGLTNFLKNHYVTPCATTPKVMKLDKKALILAPEGGIELNIVRSPLNLN